MKHAARRSRQRLATTLEDSVAIPVLSKVEFVHRLNAFGRKLLKAPIVGTGVVPRIPRGTANLAFHEVQDGYLLTECRGKFILVRFLMAYVFCTGVIIRHAHDHLFDGTNQDNVDDAVSKNRHAHGETSRVRLYPELVARGSKHWRSLYSEETISTVKVLLSSGLKRSTISEFTGVTIPVIGTIARDKAWKHVPWPTESGS